MLAAADLVHRGVAHRPTANNIVLLALAGAVVGYVVELGRRGEAALGRALAGRRRPPSASGCPATSTTACCRCWRWSGAAGRELGGEAAELGRLAAEQEQSLRALVGVPRRRTVAGEVDLRALLTSYASPVGDGVDARDAGGARRGPGPRAGGGGRAPRWPTSPRTPATARAPGCCSRTRGTSWSCRCATTGAASRRRGWRRPRAEGRLGVASSIEGRVRDLGGTMTVESAPGAGTEIELRVPVEGR